MIVKIQWPISGEPLVLIYNESRKFQAQLPTAECKGLRKLMNGRFKIFAEVHTNSGALIVDHEVSDQGW